MPASDLPTTSVVIAVRNDRDGLSATLAALAGQTVGADALEVVVVDDASTDDTAAAARAADATVVRLDAPRGAYGARNEGLRLSSGAYVAITDAGCVPAPDWIEQGIRPLLDDPMTVVAGRISMPLGERPSLAAMVDVMHHLDQLSYVEQQGSAVTANILTTRAVFDRAGLFEDRVASAGDREWVTRAREAGAALVYCEAAVVEHEPRRRARQLLRKASRVARGGSVARYAGTRLAPASSRPYLDPVSVFKPWNRQRGRERLAENGAHPGRMRWLAVGLAQIALVQVPQAAMSAYWDLRLRGSRPPR